MTLQVESQSVAIKEKNGDCILHQKLPNGVTLILLADGMGGLSFPDIATKLVCSAIAEFFQQNETGDYVELIRTCIDYADECFAEFCRERKCKMGAALTLTLFNDDRLYYTSLGDVRLYHRDRQATISLLTRDQSITQDGGSFLTSYVSGRGFRQPISVQELSLNIGDTFLLCSDGYYKTHDINKGFSDQALVTSELIEDDSTVIRVKVIEEDTYVSVK